MRFSFSKKTNTNDKNFNLNEFWLIAAPGDPTPADTLKRVQNATSTFSNNTKCKVPDLKVGTLDQLIALSDDLAKLDSVTEQTTRKLVQYFGSILEIGHDRLHENLTIGNKDPRNFLLSFQWESSKYPLKQSMKVLYELIAKQVTLIETELRTKSHAYDSAKSAVTVLERRLAGPLLSRDLSSVVPKAEIITSEYMTTVAVVVPKHSTKEWEAKYTTFADMVVPLSAIRLVDDADYALYTVTLFRKVIEKYKKRCREQKFIVRELEMDTSAGGGPNGKNERDRLIQERQRQYGQLVRWLRVNFGELYSAYVHIKVMRTFIESVLRFSLPVNFVAVFMEPAKCSHKKARVALAKLFHNLDRATSTAAADEIREEFDGKKTLAALGVEDYYPYVSFNLITDFEKKS